VGIQRPEKGLQGPGATLVNDPTVTDPPLQSHFIPFFLDIFFVLTEQYYGLSVLFFNRAVQKLFASAMI
jgi:hypothetical protein